MKILFWGVGVDVLSTQNIHIVIISTIGFDRESKPRLLLPFGLVCEVLLKVMLISSIWFVRESTSTFFFGLVCEVLLKIYISSICISSTSAGSSLSGGRDQLFFFVGWVCEVLLKTYISSIYISSTSAGYSLSGGRNQFFIFLWGEFVRRSRSIFLVCQEVEINFFFLWGGCVRCRSKYTFHQYTSHQHQQELVCQMVEMNFFFFVGWVCEVLLKL